MSRNKTSDEHRFAKMIGTNMKYLRLRKGFSPMKVLAGHIGMTHQQVAKYESGKNYYYRIPASCYHSQIFRKDTVFHEATKGPFEKKTTVFPKWAPEENEYRLVSNYLKILNIQLKAFLK